jgi:hypothetical protein
LLSLFDIFSIRSLRIVFGNGVARPGRDWVYQTNGMLDSAIAEIRTWRG